MLSDEELAALYPPYEHSYITFRDPPVTLNVMRANAERRRQELQKRIAMQKPVTKEWLAKVRKGVREAMARRKARELEPA